MESRAEGGPPAVFDWFFEAACPASLQEDPPILRQFPPDFRDQEAMQMVPKFCFPFDVEREPPSPAVQHFTFALTDLTGTRRFGFCRLRAGAHSCLCILSHHPWFEVFYKLLNTVGDLLAQDQVSEVEELLSLLQRTLPETQASVELGSGVMVSSGPGRMPPAPGNIRPLSCFVAPDAGRLPSIPENRNLTELVVAVTDENIVGLFAALLAERRVLLTASKLSTLTSCVHASCALLYPMQWEHVLIPTLPPHLLDYCCAPMPYLIGVHASLAERVLEKGLEDVVMMNVDSNILETPFDDVQALPPDVGQPVTFSEEAFLAQKPGAPLQAFHRRAVHLQLFKQFIDGRLEKLNTGEGFSDLFEQEITCSGASSGTLRSYQLWADNLKKGGGALLHSVKAKTQPTVRNMYRSAKSGLKGVQSLLMYKVKLVASGGGGDGEVGSWLTQPLPRTGILACRGGAPSGLSPSPVAQITCSSVCLSPSTLDRTGPFAPAGDTGRKRDLLSPWGRGKAQRQKRGQYCKREARTNGEDGPQISNQPEPPDQSWGFGADIGGYLTSHRTPSLSPEDTQDSWAEEALDSSFLGSGEELDLLSEILDSLSTGATRTGSLRSSQSLDCCHREDSDSCLSLPNLPGRQRWQPDEEDLPEPYSQSLPAGLPSLQSPQPPDTTGSSRNLTPSEASQEVTSLTQSLIASAEPSSRGDLQSSLTEPHRQTPHLSPLHEAAGEPRGEERSCSQLSTAPTQPSRAESPQPPLPTKPHPDTTWTWQTRGATSDAGFPESPRAPAVPASNWQEPQARNRPRVAELKKCFEG
ncbi:DENN domain-containing protein 1C isoform X2 [Pipistrellus kuhlii]|uniref:DENN domain-containing protein 1C isoform X2 n=1 Tax=Pipistrellus kuhlii TaxID=59472 RepID=UPI001E26F29B|nr:DENN domain-containing protein 1C isoform X2 [Pipistrellus kuhlii]